MLILIAALALQAASPAPVTDADLTACLGTAEFAGDRAALAAARAEVSIAEWDAACRKAREADARRVALTQAIVRGEATANGFQPLADIGRYGREATDPVHVELFRRVARDQAARNSLTGKAAYAPDLSGLALRLLDARIGGAAVAADAENRAWLEQVVAERGWFTLGRDGEVADRTAWMIVQHGDMDRDFQRRMIAVLEPLAAKGETSANRFALLYDRWAAGAGRPQRYGLQGRCAGPGQWEPLPIEDVADVDARRAAAGLPPLAEHVAKAAARCT